MPTDSIMVVSFVVAAFVIFAIALAYASATSSK